MTEKDSGKLPPFSAKTFTLHWHNNSLPVYSVDFQPNRNGKMSSRFATGGGDNNVRIWRLCCEQNGSESVEYLSTLSEHTQAVNCVRFSPTGEYLASASDDGTVKIWKLSDKIIRKFGNDDYDMKESWYVKTVCTTSPRMEIYDICWSPDSRFICCGSMNQVVVIFDATIGSIMWIANHSHYVQGVSWDPRNEYICSQSADRSVQVYKVPGDLDKSSPDITNGETSAAIKPVERLITVSRIRKAELASERIISTQQISVDSPPDAYKLTTLYHNDTLQSFFRRLTFSPDGLLLLSTSGIYKTASSPELNTVYIHTRSGLDQPPVAHIPGFKKPSIAIKFSPVIYNLLPGEDSCFKLPYRMVFAVATQDSVVIFDTQRLKPLGIAANIHYAAITDISWCSNGQVLLTSSTDGFVSRISLDESLLGKDIETYDATMLIKKFPIKKNITTQDPLADTTIGTRLDTPTNTPVTTTIVDMLAASSSDKRMQSSTLSIIATVVVAFVILNYFMSMDSRTSSTHSSTSIRRRRHDVTAQMIETVQQIAPNLTMAQIRYDLERTGDVNVTIDRYLNRGTLPNPPGTVSELPSETSSEAQPETAFNSPSDKKSAASESSVEGPFNGLSFEAKRSELAMDARAKLSRKAGLSWDQLKANYGYA
ncbi:hypothetical protein FOA43_004010 [Brettanomyces nanus]|uniref:CUE domain-containing protein n=1 Tax=Eeniella nana TaxID=13502 RepID=A0A875S6P3_EENNA|nr:uncharacterized protein FOA43_004010 [Brettanomyces nanus]QPG76618.1 hypothetical protein FOA43_004010 [Brettanomyces nanus]